MNSFFKRSRYAVTAVTTVIALLAGFLLGRVTAPAKNSEDQTVQTKEDAADTNESAAQEDTADAERTPADETEETDPAAQHEKDLNGDLVDAADQTYDTSQTSEMITHEAQSEVGTEETTVDPSEIENPTLTEAPLPDGVASTLYGKTEGTARFQVVVMGDSQFGNFLGTDGLAYLLSQKLHANVYNLSIGGKCAAW